MASWLRTIWRRIHGERRHRLRPNRNHVEYLNRQYAVAVKAARKLHTTPEELLDYRRADRILGKQR